MQCSELEFSFQYGLLAEACGEDLDQAGLEFVRSYRTGSVEYVVEEFVEEYVDGS